MTDPGVYPAGLTDYIRVEDRLTTEIIPDGVHVHPLLVEKTLRCKGLGRMAFVTDGVQGAGNPPGIYDGLYPGVQVAITANRGVRRVPDDTLSGARSPTSIACGMRSTSSAGRWPRPRFCAYAPRRQCSAWRRRAHWPRAWTRT
jgi:N-acetylglucosamine-6-phosphate deacetylase